MPNAICFLDTEFTDLTRPELLSLGLIALNGREHYVELDLASDIGKARIAASSDFVRHGGVLDQWELVPDAACDYAEMGRRTAACLIALAGDSRSRVEVAFDYWTDYELLERAIRDCGLWYQVRGLLAPVNVGPLTGSPEGEIAAEGCFRELARRGLGRHHALADASALRTAYIAAKAVAADMARETRSDTFRQLAKHALQLGLEEAWLRAWLMAPAFGLGGRRPMDVLAEPGGLDTLQDLLVRIAHGVYS